MSTLESQLQEVTELISLPDIYIKFNQLMDDPTSDNEDFAKLVQLDPSLTAKLLQVVNSAYFGFAGEISNVSRAVNMIGIQQLHIMVLSISAVNALSTLTFPQDIVDLKAFWRSSLLSATLSRDLAQQLGMRPYDRFFILGLLHEIGHLVLYNALPDLARRAMGVTRDKNVSITDAEQEVMGCHYGQIGARLMQYWQLPEEFQVLTQYQPTPGQSPQVQRETSVLNISHGFAYRQFIDQQAQLDELIDPIAWEATGFSERDVEAILGDALKSCSEMEMIILN